MGAEFVNSGASATDASLFRRPCLTSGLISVTLRRWKRPLSASGFEQKTISYQLIASLISWNDLASRVLKTVGNSLYG